MSPSLDRLHVDKTTRQTNSNELLVHVDPMDKLPYQRDHELLPGGPFHNQVFALSGGEFAALLMIDAVTRLIPGVVGREESVLNESFMDGLLDCPHYTRPATLKGNSVPEVLLSGNHKEIRQWREGEALRRTRQRRPDLLKEESLAKART